MPIKVKTRIYETYILPVVLYGLECITWSKKIIQQTEVFQNHVMRFITGHRLIERVKIEDLRKKTKLLPISTKI